MRKKTVIFLCILIFVVAAGFCAYTLGMNYIQDRAVNTILKNQISDMLDGGELSLDELAQALGDDFIVDYTPSDGETDEPSEDKGEEQNSVTPTKEANGKEETPPAKKPDSVGDKKTDQPSAASREEVIDKTTEMLESKISRKDKQEIMKLIGSRLTAADVSYLAGLLRNGLSSEDLKEAKKLAFSRFTKAEISKVHAFYHKYIGLIQREK